MRSTARAFVLALAGCTATPPPPTPHLVVAAPAERGEPALLLHDTFDASPTTPSDDFGLDADLVHRQRGALVPATYSMLSGVWFDAPPAAPGTVRVGHLFEDGAAGRLSFHGFGAVRMNRPFTLDRAGVLRVRARIDPVVGDVASMGWVSLVLTPVRDGSGWVLDPRNAMGFLLRSNGGVGLGSLGQDRPPHWVQSPPAPAPGYDVTLDLRTVSNREARRIQVDGRVNEASFSATLADGAEVPLQAGVYLELGAHFHGGDPKLSSVDDLFVFGAAASSPVDGAQTLPERMASNCGPGDSPSPEAVKRYVEEIRGLLLAYEELVGPALGGAAWPAQRASFRARLTGAADVPALSQALATLEAAFAARLPEGWAARRDDWAHILAEDPPLRLLLEAVKDLLGASRGRVLDDDGRERLRRLHVRLSLLVDTCL